MSFSTVDFSQSFAGMATLGTLPLLDIRRRIGALFLVVVALMGSDLTATAGVHSLFDTQNPVAGPFPSDSFTVPDSSHNTGRKVNLPMPDCAAYRSDCEDLEVINALDGFNIDPRLSISFDGPIDVTTVTSNTVFLVSLDVASCGDNNPCDDAPIGINQIVWDPQTHMLNVQSDKFLRQHARYAIIVTGGVRDSFGQPVEATEIFRRFRETVRGEYKQALLEAIEAAGNIGIGESDIVTASVFTTQSVTSVLEKVRDQIKAGSPEPADFRLGPGGARTVFPLDTVTGITWDQQTGDDPLAFTRVTVNSALLGVVPGTVGTIAFGKYTSPDYEVHPGEYIPPLGTRTGTPDVQGTNEIYFNLFLPSGPKPAAGWPVAIFGHGNTQNKNLSFNVAATLAAHGIATIAINAVGHGLGRLGMLTVNRSGGEPFTFSSGGRGIDQNGNHVIEPGEGFASAPPRTINFFVDGIRQTAADLMQLVRVIEVGVDVDGDGSPDLDPARIYYFGHSLGGNYGTVFLSVETSVKTGVLNSPGAPILENRRLSPGSRPGFGQSLAARTPPLINTPGITSLDGTVAGPPQFNENFPLRNGIPIRVQLADGTVGDVQSPVINAAAGALAIQDLVENTKWVGRSGDPTAFAPYLQKSSLPGVPAKLVFFQYAKGDQTAPNPNAATILRAGDLADRTSFYRHDLAYSENPMLPKNPHGFMVSTDIVAFRPIALAAQEQIAAFFTSDGTLIPQPEPTRFFETPIMLPLPEDLSFIR